MKKRYRQYEQIIRDIDIERVTLVEIDALEDEMASDQELDEREWAKLVQLLHDVVGDKF